MASISGSDVGGSSQSGRPASGRSRSAWRLTFQLVIGQLLDEDDLARHLLVGQRLRDVLAELGLELLGAVRAVLGATKARTNCPPRCRSLMPTTAAAAIAACPASTRSTSNGPNVLPLDVITSSARPTNVKTPSSSTCATSPVRYQSPRNADFVSSGSSQ